MSEKLRRELPPPRNSNREMSIPESRLKPPIPGSVTKHTGDRSIGHIAGNTGRVIKSTLSRIPVKAVLAKVEEKEAKKVIQFPEVALLLKKEGYDIEQYRDAAVDLHEQLGVVRLFQEKGIITTVDEYKALFDQTEFSAQGIHDFIEFLRGVKRSTDDNNERWKARSRPEMNFQESIDQRITPIFNPGHLTYKELIDILIKSSGMPLILSDDVEKSDFLKVNIDDIDIEELVRLDGQEVLVAEDWDEKREPLRRAYNSVPYVQTPKPRMIFTTTEMRETNLTAIDCLLKAKDNSPMITPEDDLFRWIGRHYKFVKMLTEARMKMKLYFDNALTDEEDVRGPFERIHHMDRSDLTNRVSLYPLHVYPNGKVLSLKFERCEGTYLWLISEDPGYKENIYGVRRELYC